MCQKERARLDSERAERMRREKGIPENPVKLVDEFSSTGQGQRTACYDPGPGSQPTDNEVPGQRRNRQLLDSVRISDSEAHGTDGGWLMEVTLDHIGPTLDRTSAPLPTLPLCQLCPFAATKTSQTEVRVAHATDFQQNRAWGLLWKHSQLLSRGSDTLAVLPALRSGSRRPRSSPATPSASPCGARCARLRRRSRTGAAQREIFSRIETSRGNTHSSCLAAPIH